MARPDQRQFDQIRETVIHPYFLHNAKGSVLIEVGKTRVICAVSATPGAPRWKKEQGIPGGWITGEYSMLPGATHSRKPREISKGHPDGRSQEIQRLIGRSLRAMVNLEQIGDFTLHVDCDVIDADGGTRCASITGATVALNLALRKLFAEGGISNLPAGELVAAVSVGIVNGEPVLDLNYKEDSAADVDMNVIMTESGRLVEIQGTGEESTFTRQDVNRMLDLAEKGCRDLFALQRLALQAKPPVVARG